MADKVATVNSEDIPWNQYPKDWPEVIKLDYQEKTKNIVDIADVANDANATSQEQKRRNDEQDIVISRNTNEIESNSKLIAENTKGIENNSNDNAETKRALEEHEGSISAHGVKGNNVGTEDYASSGVGGVVLSAVNIKPVSLRTVSVNSAPDNYDKEYIQKIADAINDLSANQQAIASKIEEVLNAQKDAKQMQPDS